MSEGSARGVSYGRFAALAVALITLLGLVGWRPTERLAGEGGVQAMLAAGGLVLVASLLGALPVALVRGRTPLEALPAVLGSVGLRLGLVMGLALLLAVVGWFDPAPFLLWVVLGHLVLLVPDTWYALRNCGAPWDGSKKPEDEAE